MYTKVATLAALLITTGCSMIPTVPVETHCRYASNGSPARYSQCMQYQKRLKEQREQSYGYNQAPERPLFDTGVNGGLEMNPEARMLMDIGPSSEHQRDESIVIRDASFSYQDHRHANHQHNDNIVHDERELRRLEMQISKMQERLDSSRKHKAEHDEIEAVFAQHKGAW